MKSGWKSYLDAFYTWGIHCGVGELVSSYKQYSALRLSAGTAGEGRSRLKVGRSLLAGNGQRRFEVEGDQLQDEQMLYWTQGAHNVDTWQPLVGAIAASLYTTEIGEQVGPSQVSVFSRAQLGADYSP